jgi:SAM-dependent methyltransferase
VSPVEDYVDEAAEILHVLRTGNPSAKTLLELGSGGGHLAHYLKRAFECHLTDLSEAMLDNSRRLNPECTHVVGDMRTLELGRTFDVVLAHDAIDYMCSEADLCAAIDTAWKHLGAGGLACFIPDEVAETFEPGASAVGGGNGADGRAVRLFEWSEPLGAQGPEVTVHYAFLIRDKDGIVRSVYDRHTVGVFPQATWERLLSARGFAVEVIRERTEEDRLGRLFFLGRKPESDVGTGEVHGALPVRTP